MSSNAKINNYYLSPNFGMLQGRWKSKRQYMREGGDDHLWLVEGETGWGSASRRWRGMTDGVWVGGHRRQTLYAAERDGSACSGDEAIVWERKWWVREKERMWERECVRMVNDGKEEEPDLSRRSNSGYQQRRPLPPLASNDCLFNMGLQNLGL